ncbi:recombinase family protein [Lacticaseibacillus suibinensis]|uniref:recombinase family protein n=1 Tax=Lacticaseibacillus suibinensis TaxID=2486011 RepID=UPI000F77214D|nr:recombinase family protein [Lacticaseibacillus suibinensis]
MTKVGYARVSTREQNLDRQLSALKGAGCTRIFQEKRSGATLERPELAAMLHYIHDDDEVVVVALDRLGRSAADLTETINTIGQQGATLNVLNLPTFSEVPNKAMRTMLTNLTLEIYKYIAQEEREAIHERQAAGIIEAKRRGVYKGGVPQYSADSPDKHRRYIYNQAITMLEDGKLSKAQIARTLGISRPTLYRIVAEIPESIQS